MIQIATSAANEQAEGCIDDRCNEAHPEDSKRHRGMHDLVYCEQGSLSTSSLR
jgi:hypothetical protein